MDEFRRVHSTQKVPEQQRPAGRKHLSNPHHTDHILIMWVMKLCRAILFVDIDTWVLARLYLVGVIIVSVLGDLFVVPKTFLADKRNPLNQYFIKWGWGWTITCVSSYIILTTLVYCCRDFAQMAQHLTRIAIGTLLWYVCISLFVRISDTMGVCTQPEHIDKFACVKAGESWYGFDISGHIFLEMFCILIILEEVKTFKGWKKLGHILHDSQVGNRRTLTENEILQAQRDYNNLTPYINCIVIFITIIVVLFNMMLFTTAIYPFHALSHKVLAAPIAVFCWFLSYRIFFQSGNPYPFVPVMPGHSYLGFMNAS